MSSPANVRREALASQEPKRHEVAGLIVLAAAVLLALALSSYNVNGGADWVGPAGARAAETLLALLGTAAVLIPWSLAVLAVRLFRRTVRPVRFGRSLGSAAIVVAVATALHLWLGEGAVLGGLAAGGLVGSVLGEGLRATVGTAGADTIVLTALLVALVVRTRLSVVSVAAGARSAGTRGGLLARNGAVTVARAWREARDAESRARKARAAAVPALDAPETLTTRALQPVLEGALAPLDEDDEQGAFGSGVLDLDPEGPLFAALSTRPSEGAPPEVTPSEVAARPRPGRRARKKSDAEAVDTAVDAPVLVSAQDHPAHVMFPAAPEEDAADEDDDIPEAAPVPTPPIPRSRSRRKEPARGIAPEAPEAREAPEDEAIEPLPDEAEALPLVTLAARPPRLPRAPLPRAQPRVANEPVEAVPEEAPAQEDAAEGDDPLTIVSHAREIERAMRRAPGALGAAPAVIPPSAAVEMALPSTDLLTPPPTARTAPDEAQLRAVADRLVKTLADYTIDGRVMEIHPGPVVTTYEVLPAAGTKLSKIARLGDDIAMSLEASKVRIVAPIPGKGRVGFEIPNTVRQTVYFRELIETEAFRSLGGALPVALGKDVVGAPYFADLATMPHLIVAGATGAGKSVGLNVMLASLLYKRSPEDVRLLMIDPKMVELAVYDNIPHMLLPVVTDMKKATLALRWVVDEMERRYSLFAQTGSRNIVTYNERVAKALAEGKALKGSDGPVRTKETGTTVALAAGDTAAPAPPRPRKLPYILCVVDEFADLIMVAGKDIESAVARLAQKARAAGIHVILATQRPSVDVITGMIKANFPARIAFKVSQKVDSRTILDQQGAEHLLGRGDMLILPPGSSDLRRVHCAFVSEDEVQRVTDHWRAQGRPTFDEDILKPRDDDDDTASDDGPAEIKVPQEKYEKAVQLVITGKKCSVSYVQRYLGIGYNVAARIVDKMEREGVVGPPKGPGKDREVLA